jgi:hypothetical protein
LARILPNLSHCKVGIGLIRIVRVCRRMLGFGGMVLGRNLDRRIIREYMDLVGGRNVKYCTIRNNFHFEFEYPFAKLLR